MTTPPARGFRTVSNRISRYRPETLLPAIARHTSTLEHSRISGDLSLATEAPWIWAAIARESLLRGKKTGAQQVSEGTLRHLYDDCFNSFDGIDSTGPVAVFLTQMAHEQFTVQEGIFNPLARVHCLLVDDSSGEEWPWAEVIGAPIDAAIRALVVIHAWAANNGGLLDPAWMNRAENAEIFARVAPREDIEAVRDYLTQTLDQARAAHATPRNLVGDALRHRFNPLEAKPLVLLKSGELWSPIPHYIANSLTLKTLYYVGHRWGPRFTSDLGHRVERYVGKQLRQLAGAAVHDAIKWTEQKQRLESVDFIWVDDDAVFLVESKSARMTVAARSSDRALADHVDNYLGEARDQIDRTAEAIRNNRPEFSWVPRDRPWLGIVVTSEPFYLGNSQLSGYGKPGSTPSTVISHTELEHLTAQPRHLGVPRLIAHVTESASSSFSAALRSLPVARNGILDQAFAHYRWLDEELQESLRPPGSTFPALSPG